MGGKFDFLSVNLHPLADRQKWNLNSMTKVEQVIYEMKHR